MQSTNDDDKQWEHIVAELNRKALEQIGELIGLKYKYQYLIKNSMGMQRDIYKKELKKIKVRLKKRTI